MAYLPQQFYNLNADPFRLSPDHHFSFPHRTFKNGFADLKLGLVGEERFIVITGRPGTGKTTLINKTIAQLDTNKVVIANLATNQYEAHDLLCMIASSFNLNCYKESKSSILPELEKFLRMRHSEGKRALLIVDEAQGIRADALEELQALSNLQDEGKPLLQIILIGQEELRDIINSPELENLRKRVISSLQLEPLSESETIDYIAHRLDHAGWTGDPEITRGAGCLIYHFSAGIPRIINRICNRLLLHGWVEEKHELNADDIKSVLEKLFEERLVTEKYIVPSDIAEKVNLLGNEYIQPLNRLIKTSGPAEYPGFFNNPESTIETDESTDNVSAENNSCGDTRDSNDESQVYIEATVFDSPTSQPLDARERSRWPDNYVWLAVPAAIAIAVGLKIYSGVSQDHTQIQSHADIDSRYPVHKMQLAEKIQVDIVPANDNSMRDNKVKNAAHNKKSLLISTYNGNNSGNNHNAKEKHLDRLETQPERVNEAVQLSYGVANSQRMNPSADKPETANKASKTSTVTDVKPVEHKQAKINEIASNTSPALTKITPELTPVRTVNKTLSVKTLPLVIAKPARPTGEKQSGDETKTATGHVPQSLNTKTAPGITAEPVEPTQVTASGESVLPGEAESAAIHRSRAAPIKQTSKPFIQLSPRVKRTTETLTQEKADPVIIKPKKSSMPVRKKLQKARVTSNITEAADSASLMMDTLLARQWVTDTRQQAPHLPSFITNCSATPGSIECWSREHFIENNGKSVRVKTKSYLKDFTESGFTIRYKHMLLGGANDKGRWEDKIHQLDCTIIYRDKIKCREDGDNDAVIFTRITSDQLINHFTHTLLISAKWIEDNQPATFLPSSITSCQLESGRLSCWSKSRKHKSSSNTATIKTKALIGKIIDGNFIVKYRNLAMSASGSSAWENNTHEARCSIQDFNKIVCKEDNNLLTYTKDIQNY